MRIVVYGAGAVGAFFGGLMARAGREVQFVARGAHLQALQTRGLRIDSRLMGQVDVPPLRAVERAADLGPADVVLVCVKTHQTPGILDDLATIVGDSTVIVPLQNGVESDEVLAARFGRRRVAAAVVYVGATVEQPGVLTHFARGTIVLGAPPGFDAARLPALQAALSAPGHAVTISEDIRYDRWHKLIWNAAFNTVSAATGRAPAALLEIPESRALLVGIMREVIAVANAQGIRLHESDIDDQIAWTEGATAIRTSMMVDRARGRDMETDDLIGVIVRRGAALGVPTPFSAAMLGVLKAL
jgi:2-dehydropantoate 2-reductase